MDVAQNKAQDAKSRKVNFTVGTPTKDMEILAISKNPDGIEQMTNAVQKLRNDIITRFEDPSCVTLMMHVNLNTAKADLIPFPNRANMEKLRGHFNELPKRVQNVITKSIPEEDMAAVHVIWDLLDSQLKEVKTVVEDKVPHKAHQPVPNNRKEGALPYTKILNLADGQNDEKYEPESGL
jgi:hypothetical protein